LSSEVATANVCPERNPVIEAPALAIARFRTAIDAVASGTASPDASNRLTTGVTLEPESTTMTCSANRTLAMGRVDVVAKLTESDPSGRDAVAVLLTAISSPRVQRAAARPSGKVARLVGETIPPPAVTLNVTV
jgi:hypothetical protein